MRPSYQSVRALRKSRGRRECRVKASPMARLQKRKQAAVTTGSARSSGIPCAVVYGLYVISSGTGSLAPVACELVAIRRLGISTGMPGPHDFAVRDRIVRRQVISSLRRAPVHRISGPTLVTIAKRPSHRAGTCGNVELICPTWQVIIGCDKVTRRAVFALGPCGAPNSPLVIPGRAQREPGIHNHRISFCESRSDSPLLLHPPVVMDSGLDASHRPGMTAVDEEAPLPYRPISRSAKYAMVLR
jgi:hypothetical protein